MAKSMTGRKDYKRALVTIAGAKCTLTADERGWLIYRHGGYCRISGVYSEGVQIDRAWGSQSG
jgi:hypothetical protein